jgi:hypothetical protein
MVVLLHFLTSTGGRTISPRTGSLPEDPKAGAKFPIQSIELSTVSCSHTNAHIYTNTAGPCGWNAATRTPNRNIIAEEASQSREMRHTEESQGGAEQGPPLEGD